MLTFRRPRHATVVAYLALFAALGGTAYALQNNSVRSRHIVNGHVKSPDVRNNGLKGRDIDESTLRSLEGPVVVRTGVIPPETEPGSGGTKADAYSPRCHDGEQLLGGGYGETEGATTETGFGTTYDVTFAGPGVIVPNPDYPDEGPKMSVVPAEAGDTPDAYRFTMEFEGHASNPEVTIYAICAK